MPYNYEARVQMLLRLPATQFQGCMLIKQCCALNLSIAIYTDSGMRRGVHQKKHV